MAEQKEFDLIVYGASGFTGRLVAEYLHQHYSHNDSLRWAIAGRSASKLEAAKEDVNLPGETPTLVVDPSNEESLKEMVNSTRVIISTVGPYQLYGNELLALCASQGTDYVDLCGEPTWMRKMIDAHEQTAKDSGARIVFSCGFDSIPSDLGILFLQNAAEQQHGSVCNHISARVKSLKGTFSGGTAASFLASVQAAKEDPEVYQMAMNPYACVPGFEGVEQPDGETVHYDEALDSWVAPFIMAAVNTRNVHRSNYLFDHRYGRDFTYDEMMLTGPGEKGEEIARHIASDKGMGGEDAPKPGEGPSKEEREAGSYHILYLGRTKDGQELMASVKGDKDPGYGSTSKMISESAICLLNEASETKGGIWTPATAMGVSLISRLENHAGLTFSMV